MKIAPGYSQPVVHVLDASRAVPIVGSLISAEQKPAFVEKIRERIRPASRAARQPAREAVSASKRRGSARRNSTGRRRILPQPEFIGRRALDDFPLADLVPFIDWSPFFHTWELRGRYPAILNHEKHGEEARKLFADAQKLLERIVSDKLLTARGVYGFFPANAVGDDVELYTDDTREKVLTTFHFLRQQIEKPDGQPSFSLADFIAPKGSGLPDHLGAFAVTSGHGLKELVEKFKSRPRRLQRHHGRSSRGPSRRSLRRVPAQARPRGMGLRQGRKPDDRRSH